MIGFGSQKLVIIRGLPKVLSTLKWHQLEEYNSYKLKTVLQKVTVIPRSLYGQMYIAQGLSRSPHFSLGTKGVDLLSSFCSKRNIALSIESGVKNFEHAGTSEGYQLLVKSVIPTKATFIETGYIKLINEMTNCLWDVLFDVNRNDTYRAPNIINLGITDQKCDQYVRCSVTGRVGLNLISTTTKKMKLSTVALLSIGKLLMFVIDYCLPSTTLKHVFETQDKYELHYIRQFGQQLGLSTNDLPRFVFPAISILVNRYLNCHCDSMNPTDPLQDYTMAISSQVQSDTCPLPLRLSVQKTYPITVPMCVVMYRRKALNSYARRMHAIDNYCFKKHDERHGRTKLVSLLKSVETDADYIGMFFDRKGKEKLLPRFSVNNTSFFKHKMAIIPEAIDKMAYFSSLLHVFYLYIYCSSTVCKETAINFVLFFGHQCNTTVTIVSAMLCIIENNVTKCGSSKVTLYAQLAKTCCVLKGQKNNKNIDVGCGINNRHQPSNNRVYTKEEVYSYVFFLNNTFEDYTRRSNKIQHQMCCERFELFMSLNNALVKELPGIGHLRATHIILMAALMGLLPLEFYVYVPMHLNGGPGTFMKEEMGWNSTLYGAQNDVMLVKWTVTTMKELQFLFTTEYTPNMNENASCILGRKTKKYDTHYFLPWYDSSLNQLTEPKMQLHFRLNGRKSNHWHVETHDGLKIITMSGYQSSKKCLDSIYNGES